MMENSKIAWTDHTFNPWVGCSPVSEACANCYAAAMAKRNGQNFSERRLTKTTWGHPLKWQREAVKTGTRPRVFCGSMCDVMDPEVPREWKSRLFGLLHDTPDLWWLLLTKRAESLWAKTWPDNVWIGVTAENHHRLAQRAVALQGVDCGGFFASVEPMLGRIHPALLEPFDWVILGCEKIAHRPGRPTHSDWIREVCEARQGPTFVKQMVINGAVEDDPERFPEWARRREVPGQLLAQGSQG
jgi:protein gp37